MGSLNSWKYHRRFDTRTWRSAAMKKAHTSVGLRYQKVVAGCSTQRVLGVRIFQDSCIFSFSQVERRCGASPLFGFALIAILKAKTPCSNDRSWPGMTRHGLTTRHLVFLRLTGRREKHFKNDKAEDEQDTDHGDNSPFKSRHHHASFLRSLADCVRPTLSKPV